MSKKRKDEISASLRYNRISKPANVLFNLLFIILSLTCIVPLVFVVIISFTSEASIQQAGYSFIPKEWSLSAYSYIWEARESILRAYGISILITVAGTVLGLILNASMGYVLSRSGFKLKKFFTYVVLIPMLFSGGMISFYLVVVRFLNIKDTLWALILPLAVSSFYVVILRIFFQQTIPDAIVESAKIDGASQLSIFFRIVLPISLPALATIGLFLTFAYWNDWFNALLFIDDGKLVPLQALLMRIEKDIQFIQKNLSTLGAYGNTMELPSETAKMAIVVLVTLPIACTYPFFQKYFVSGLTVGAVKG